MPLHSHDPATGALVGTVDVTSAEQIPTLVAAARAAQPAWRALGVKGRAELLRPVGERILERSEALAELLTREMGKPLREALGEVRSVGTDWSRELDECIEAFSDEVLEDRRVRTTLRRDPFGVAAAITPWNFPFSMPHWMVFPSLLAGNTVLLKPSEETPLIGEAYAALLQEVLPEGVLQVVHGDGTQGAALVASELDLIAFTGSAATGRRILRDSAGRLPKVLLELGGKDPLVVLDDADLDAAARFAATNSFRNCGQVCISTERIYVQSSVAAAFTDKLLSATAALPVGSGLERGTRIGPMISARQRSKVVGQVVDALDRGGRLLIGGEDLHEDGLFLRPMVLTDAAPDWPVVAEETFGPVAVLTPVDSDDDAVNAANGHPYQLGAVVFGSPDRAEALADRLDAGMVGVNGGIFGAAGSPWVGARQSGVGFHHGVDGHRQFAQLRTITRAR